MLTRPFDEYLRQSRLIGTMCGYEPTGARPDGKPTPRTPYGAGADVQSFWHKEATALANKLSIDGKDARGLASEIGRFEKETAGIAASRWLPGFLSVFQSDALWYGVVRLQGAMTATDVLISSGDIALESVSEAVSEAPEVFGGAVGGIVAGTADAVTRGVGSGLSSALTPQTLLVAAVAVGGIVLWKKFSPV